MSSWFARNFRSATDAVIDHARDAIAETRHEILAGQFGRNFEPHPTRARGDSRTQGERDIHGNEQGNEPKWFVQSFNPTNPVERDIHGNDQGLER